MEHEKQAAVAAKEILVGGGTGAAAALPAVEPRLLLSKVKLMVLAFFGLGIVVGFMQTFVHGVTIETDVVDPVGSSINANTKVYQYQTINGYVMTFLDTIRDGYFAIFLPVIITFLANVRLFPGDHHQVQNTNNPTRSIKQLILFWILPVLNYVLGVGFSSLYIGHKVVGLRRVFLDGDLRIALPKRGIVTDVENTVLRSAVRRKVDPFEILTSSSCVKPNKSTQSNSTLAQLLGQNNPVLPTMDGLDTTTVVYGFPLQDWNYEVIPRRINPKYAVNITMHEYTTTPESVMSQFEEFQDATDFDFVTAYEMFLQGKLLLERAISDSVHFEYPCSDVDGQTDLDKTSDASSAAGSSSRRRLLDGPAPGPGGPITGQTGGTPTGGTPTGGDPSGGTPTGGTPTGGTPTGGDPSGGTPTGGDPSGGTPTGGTPTGGTATGGAPPGETLPPPGGTLPPSGGTLPPPGGSLPPPDGALPPPGGALPPPGTTLPPPPQDAATTTPIATTFTSDNGMVYDADGNVVDFVGATFNFDQYANEPVNWEYYDDGRRKCRGAPSTLPHLKDMYNQTANVTNLDSFLNITSQAFDFFPNVNTSEIQYRFEQVEISPMINVTSITMDFPVGLAEDYNMMNDTFCSMSSSDLPSGMTTTTQELLCNRDNYVYTRHNAMCGSSSCVFIDKNKSIPIPRQLLLLPTLSNCNVSSMKYDADLSNFFPTNCTPHNDSVFLYGFGTYVSGDSFTSGVQDDFYPQIQNPQRHAVFTIAKLQWELKDLAAIFGTKCTAKPDCYGLAHRLGASPRYLVLGQKFLPVERLARDFRDPVQLVSLNTKPFYYPDLNEYHEWEHLSLARFNTTSWDANETLSGTHCSMLVDSYLAQVENNAFYLEEPLQPLYTSALYYLFQDAAVKSINNSVFFAGKDLRPRNTTGLLLATLHLAGDQEVKKVGFSISLNSAITTIVGIGTMLLLSGLVLACPTMERVRLPNKPDQVVEKIVEVLTTEDYPTTIHQRKLVLSKSQQPVDLDEFQVESLQLEQQKGRHVRVQL